VVCKVIDKEEITKSPLGIKRYPCHRCVVWGAGGSLRDIGSPYALACRDATGQYFDGANIYRLHLPPGIPAMDFWSVVVYDPQTRSMLQSDQQFPSTSSQKKGTISFGGII
jgi:hypothetical protein